MSSPWLPDSPLESSVSVQETLEFSTCARLPCFFNLSQLFLANSLAEAAHKTSPICPSLISFQLPGWTFSIGALMETQTSEKTSPSVVRSYIKPCLLRGPWLQEAVTGMELGRWLWLRLCGGLCGNMIVCILVFIYLLVLFSSS